MFKKAKENKKGFTLAELLIVVAIIAVLVAISIPIFTAQLEKSREATDEANLRAAYAEVSAAALTDTATASSYGTGANVTRTGDADGSYVWTALVVLKQQQDNWQSGTPNIGGITVGDDIAKKGKTIEVKYTQGTAKISFSVKSGS